MGKPQQKSPGNKELKRTRKSKISKFSKGSNPLLYRGEISSMQHVALVSVKIGTKNLNFTIDTINSAENDGFTENADSIDLGV